MILFYFVICFTTQFILVFSTRAVLYAQSRENEDKFCVQSHPEIGTLPMSSSTPFHPLVNLLPWDACEPPTEDIKDMNGSFALVIRYPCTFLKKASVAQTYGAYGLIINFPKQEPKENKTNITAVNITSNDNTTEILPEIKIPVVFMLNDSVMELLALGSDIRVKVFTEKKLRLEYSHIIVWLWAVFTLVSGSYWCGMIHSRFIHNRRRRRVQISLGMSSRASTPPTRVIAKHTIITIVMIAFAVLLMSSLLLLLYFYYKFIIYFVIAVFSIACFVSTIQLFDSFFKHIGFTVYRFPNLKLLGKKYAFNVVQIFLVIASFGLVVYWLIIRKRRFAWLLQDLLGTIFCINLLRNLRLPNAMTVTVLNLVLIFYDVFFVFITPFLTESKESVMVQVATSGGTTGEQVPMIFMIPHLKLTEVEDVCGDMPMSMLGYGDVLIPGLLTAYLHTFDIEIGKRKVYFIMSSVCYALGLVITFVAMFFMNKAQPALLYLVPCTLIPMYIVAFIRKEAKALWLGKPVLSPYFVRMSVTATGIATETTEVTTEPESGQLLTPR